MMNKFMRHVLCYGVSALLFSGGLCAETLTADIVFDKKPPKVGVLYVPGSGAPINGELNQQDKKFLSKMVVVSPNSTISFKNSDSVDHNIFANDMKTGVRFDVGLMNAFDFGQAQARLDNANATAIRTKYDYIFRLKILEFYFGVPLSLD